MTISKEVVQKVARLSRLRIDARDADIFLPRLEKILDWIEHLREVDVVGVKPLVNPMEDFVASCPLRKDKVTYQDHAKDILCNAPAQEHSMFKVPKVVG